MGGVQNSSGNSGGVGAYSSGQKLEILGRRGAYIKFPLWWGYGYFLDLHIIKLRWDCGGCPTATRDGRRLHSHATFFCEESRHLNDVSSYFNLARSVLKIALFESQTFIV